MRTAPQMFRWPLSPRFEEGRQHRAPWAVMGIACMFASGFLFGFAAHACVAGDIDHEWDYPAAPGTVGAAPLPRDYHERASTKKAEQCARLMGRPQRDLKSKRTPSNTGHLHQFRLLSSGPFRPVPACCAWLLPPRYYEHSKKRALLASWSTVRPELTGVRARVLRRGQCFFSELVNQVSTGYSLRAGAPPVTPTTPAWWPAPFAIAATHLRSGAPDMGPNPPARHLSPRGPPC